MSKPKKVEGLVPAKNGDKIGVANEEKGKFYLLDKAYLNIWLLCNGERTEAEVSEAFKNLLESETEEDMEISADELDESVKQVLKRLKKFGLVK